MSDQFFAELARAPIASLPVLDAPDGTARRARPPHYPRTQPGTAPANRSTRPRPERPAQGSQRLAISTAIAALAAVAVAFTAVVLPRPPANDTAARARPTPNRIASPTPAACDPRRTCAQPPRQTHTTAQQRTARPRRTARRPQRVRAPRRRVPSPTPAASALANQRTAATPETPPAPATPSPPAPVRQVAPARPTTEAPATEPPCEFPPC